jgi:hypothetical protein
MGQNQKGTNDAAGKIIGNEERSKEIAGFDEKCQIRLEDKKRDYSKMMNRNTKQSEKEYKDKRKEVHKIFRQKSRVLFKSKLEQMKIVYNNNEAK